MAREVVRIDINEAPALLRTVEQVHATREAALLQRDGEDLAIVMPPPRKSRPPSKAQPLTRDDPLFGLIGIGEGKTPGGVSWRKREALAHAHREYPCGSVVPASLGRDDDRDGPSR